ncbi:MAG: FCD domain-containing protein [Eubacteriales bacterium]|nr:FCD domain-containing protein [Eubacteriales bacterium]
MAGKKNVTENVIRYIYDQIATGSWKINERIPSENQLCSELGVSRVSVRSALQQYIAFGVLNSVRGKGTFLVSKDLSMMNMPPVLSQTTEESFETMKEILEFRSILEPIICGMAAKNASEELIADLEDNLAKMKESLGDGAEFVKLDMEFHMRICKATGNSVISSVMMDMFERRAKLDYMLNLSNGYYGGVYYHGMILDAIKSHNERRAKSFMDEHLSRAFYDFSSKQDQVGVSDEE